MLGPFTSLHTLQRSILRCQMLPLMTRVGSRLAGDLAFLEDKGTWHEFVSYCT